MHFHIIIAQINSSCSVGLYTICIAVQVCAESERSVKMQKSATQSSGLTLSSIMQCLLAFNVAGELLAEGVIWHQKDASLTSKSARLLQDHPSAATLMRLCSATTRNRHL